MPPTPTALFVSCPYCTARAVVDCEHRTRYERRLMGTDISCDRCNSEFELYYY
ncbi:MAG: hypothetical protein IH933_08520 [Euryarchaeota archaeon]|nr:hypothetical protein [Euryarchaeota archaeon]